MTPEVSLSGEGLRVGLHGSAVMTFTPPTLAGRTPEQIADDVLLVARERYVGLVCDEDELRRLIVAALVTR